MVALVHIEADNPRFGDDGKWAICSIPQETIKKMGIDPTTADCGYVEVNEVNAI